MIRLDGHLNRMVGFVILHSLGTQYKMHRTYVWLLVCVSILLLVALPFVILYSVKIRALCALRTSIGFVT